MKGLRDWGGDRDPRGGRARGSAGEGQGGDETAGVTVFCLKDIGHVHLLYFFSLKSRNKRV